MRRLVAPLLLVLALGACASVDPLVITGESLTAAGDTFVATAAAMHVALEQKAITVEQYRDFAAFGKRFQLTYPTAVQLWSLARDARDETTEQRVAIILADLVRELAGYTTLAAATRPDGGP